MNQRWVPALAAMVMVMSGPAMAAETPTACTAGPASQASAAQPHSLDPADDGLAPHPALDVRASWVGVRSGDGGVTYTANAVIADLGEDPLPGSIHVLRVLDANLAAVATPEDGWEFRVMTVWGRGFFVGDWGLRHEDHLTGSVDPDTNVVSIDIPANLVGQGPVTTRIRPWSGIITPHGGAEQSLVLGVDYTWAEHSCDAVLNGA